MSRLTRLGNLYLKSLTVAVPIGIVITNYEKPFNATDLYGYHDQTCAKKIIDQGGGCFLNTFFGGIASTAYLVTGPLYVAHKLETKYPEKFKICHQR
jgi:hypothetical protein